MTIDKRWDDKHFIQNIKGKLTEFPLFLVLLSVHGLKQDCIVLVESRRAKRSLYIKNGNIVGSVGFVGLLDDLNMACLPGSSMADLMGLAVSKGHRPDIIIDSIVRGLSTELLKIDPKGHITVLEFEKPSISIKIPKSIPNILMAGCMTEANENFLDSEYTSKLGYAIQANLPNGHTPESMGLPPKAIRFINAIQSDTLVHQLLGDTSVISSKWQLLHFINRMGLVSIEEQTISEQVTDRQEKSSGNTETNGTSSKAQELQKKFTELSTLEPHVLLQIVTPRDVNEVTIDRQYRKLSSEFHPDRFSLADQAVQDIAQRIFEMYTEVSSALKEEKTRVELKARLDAEERGEKYVSENDKKQSALIYEQARFLFQRRRFKDSGCLLKKCIDMNPEPWRYHYMHLQTQYHTSALTAADAGQAILEIQGVSGHQRLEVMLKAAEYLLEANDSEMKKTALAVIKQVLDVQPDHKAAIRLKSQEERRGEDKKTKSTSSNSFFKSLFKKK